MTNRTANIDTTHRQLHVIADALARLTAAMQDGSGWEPDKIYEGVLPENDPLRDREGYMRLLEDADTAINQAIGASGMESAVTIAVIG